MKKIVFTVTNDLSYDQRMDRICSALSAAGYDCLLVGRKLRASKSLQALPYSQKRISCFFEKGKLFYLEYNFRLLLFLLFKKCDAICAIDLDTALPVLVATKLRDKKLFFDAHEYFTEMEEVVTRPFIQRAWKTVEKLFLPHIDAGYTISEGYRDLYRKDYGIKLEVIRNVSVLDDSPSMPRGTKNKTIIYQGVLNVGRGLEEAIAAMSTLPEMQLHIYGEGPIMDKLETQIKDLHLQNRVLLKGFCTPAQLRRKTRNAWLGLTLFSETGLHHKYSLANRFFDYLHAGIPQLACDFPEYRKFNKENEVAVLVERLEPSILAEKIRMLDQSPEKHQRLVENCIKAREQHNWQKESEKLIRFYRENLL